MQKSYKVDWEMLAVKILLVLTIIMNLGVIIQSVKCTELTYSEVFLRLPEILIMNFKIC